MSLQFDALTTEHIDFIEKQKIFFVATAATDGFVNTSPKGMDSLRILNNTQVAWLNLTGSGNETAAHLLDTPRMTIMFCSFDTQPLILRLYGSAKTIQPKDSEWNDYKDLFPQYKAARQIYILDIKMIQNSCGFAVPFYEYKGERDTLKKWADKKQPEDIKQFWERHNLVSLDGKNTGLDEHID